MAEQSRYYEERQRVRSHAAEWTREKFIERMDLYAAAADEQHERAERLERELASFCPNCRATLGPGCWVCRARGAEATVERLERVLQGANIEIELTLKPQRARLVAELEKTRDERNAEKARADRAEADLATLATRKGLWCENHGQVDACGVAYIDGQRLLAERRADAEHAKRVEAESRLQERLWDTKRRAEAAELALATAEARVKELEASIAAHFQREHLEGDGPEIDRWRAKVKELEAERAALTKQLNDATQRSERDHKADSERLSALAREVEALRAWPSLMQKALSRLREFSDDLREQKASARAESANLCADALAAAIKQAEALSQAERGGE